MPEEDRRRHTRTGPAATKGDSGTTNERVSQPKSTSRTPRSRPTASPLLVRVEKNWWEHWLGYSALGIVIAVIAGLIVVVITRDYDPRVDSKKELKPNQGTESQTETKSGSPIVLDVIPNHNDNSITYSPNLKVHAGEEVRVTCSPGWVPSVEPDSNSDHKLKAINLWVEGVVFNPDSTLLNVAVAPWHGWGDATLEAAEGAYLTDDHGYRYDLSVKRDIWSFIQSTNTSTLVKADEIHRFGVIFPRTRPTEFLVLHYPQFQPISIILPWVETFRSLPTGGDIVSNPSSRRTNSFNAGGGTLPSTKQTPTSQNDAGLSPVQFQPVCKPGDKLAILRNGASIKYDHRRTVGAIARLFLGSEADGFVEFRIGEIDHFEECTPTDKPGSQVPSTNP